MIKDKEVTINDDIACLLNVLPGETIPAVFNNKRVIIIAGTYAKVNR